MQLVRRASSAAGARRLRRLLVVAVVVPLAGCGTGGQSPATDEAIPGPTLEGPNVVRYPLGPYEFKSPRRYIRQGERLPGGGCADVGSVTVPDGGTFPGGAREWQEITIAEDPDTCRTLVVGGEPA